MTTSSASSRLLVALMTLIVVISGSQFHMALTIVEEEEQKRALRDNNKDDDNNRMTPAVAAVEQPQPQQRHLRNKPQSFSCHPPGRIHQPRQQHMNNDNNNNSHRDCTWYTPLRSDRSGAAIQDMLTAHALCYYHNVKYGGACGDSPHSAVLAKMIQSIGLEQELVLACPGSNSTTTSSDSTTTTKTEFILVNPKIYHMQDEWNVKTLLMNQEWRDYMQGLVYQRLLNTTTSSSFSTTNHINNNTTTTVTAVHIRRGDVAPCMKGGIYSARRILPNQHYLDVLQDYTLNDNNNNHTIKIFSEDTSFESMDVWLNHDHNNDTINNSSKYEVILSGPPEQAWREFLLADTLILSRSSFSLVPAILSRNTVIYTPGWLDHPLPHWIVVNQNIMNRTERLRQEMLNNCTAEMKRLGARKYWATRKFYTYY